MVNAKDLMLENWILDATGKPMQVLQLDPDERDVPSIKWFINGESAEPCNPIPLTPELMVKIGWICTKDRMQRKEFTRTGKKGDLDVVLFNYGKYDFEKPKEVIFNVRRLRYLHELQNLYRWDVNKHLEVTL